MVRALEGVDVISEYYIEIEIIWQKLVNIDIDVYKKVFEEERLRRREAERENLAWGGGYMNGWLNG